MNRNDILKILSASINALKGNYISAGIKISKCWKVILASIVSFFIVFVVFISIIISIPSLLIQSILPGTDEELPLIEFAETQIVETEKTKKNFILSFLEKISTDDNSAELVGDEPSKEEVLMIYNVKYGGYFDENSLDSGKIKKITKTFLKRSGFKVYVRPFEEALEKNDLTDEQKTIAMNMYANHMYDQTIRMSDSDILKDLGNVRYKEGATEVVYFSQRDERWAKAAYGDGTIGAAGCGPSCLSIVVSSLTDKTYTPKQMCEWAYKKGYKSEGGGSYWTLIPEGAKAFGLEVEGSVKEAQDIVDALTEGKLIIVIMGPGTFTSSGHFIVLRGVTEEGKILVADPYTPSFNKKEWDLSLIIEESKKGSAAGGPFWIISN